MDRLSGLLKEIDQSKAHFLLSYARSPEILSRFSSWRISEVETDRNIAGFAKYRQRVTELIITNIN